MAAGFGGQRQRLGRDGFLGFGERAGEKRGRVAHADFEYALGPEELHEIREKRTDDFRTHSGHTQSRHGRTELCTVNGMSHCLPLFVDPSARVYATRRNLPAPGSAGQQLNPPQ
ncbi:hypothetical protein GCM10010371_22580 [Streptomyces subrutilus]|uniref:Uncharacterized protein n=1 Tax=Streptomyces subrutilus TaxID=36818 RepID=A0A918QQ66_9ACTN|nr:hypothetical protein GCM10010371_22580 [Streptomyces subrutilus]